MISWSGLRGAVAIAFSVLVVNSGAEISMDIYYIVFCICLLSSLVQGYFMPAVARKLDMIDEKNTVLRNFNYYSMRSDIVFSQFHIDKDSVLNGRYIKEVKFEGNFVVSKIIRNDEVIIPRGDVKIIDKDLLVIAGIEYFDEKGQDLIEFTVSKDSEWVNKTVSELKLPLDRLLLAINKDEKFILAEIGRAHV